MMKMNVFEIFSAFKQNSFRNLEIKNNRLEGLTNFVFFFYFLEVGLDIGISYFLLKRAENFAKVPVINHCIYKQIWSFFKGSHKPNFHCLLFGCF